MQFLSQLWHKAAEIGAWVANLPEKAAGLRDGLVGFCDEAKTFYNVVSGAVGWAAGVRSFWGGLWNSAKTHFVSLTESELGRMVNGKWASMLLLFEEGGDFGAFFDSASGALTQVGVALVDVVESFTIFEDFQTLVDAAYQSLIQRDLNILLVALDALDDGEAALETAALNQAFFGPALDSKSEEVYNDTSA